MLLGALAGCKHQDKYVTYPDDPMNVQAYTLENGLKVFMSVNKEQPRIHCQFAVRTGSKNDPAETTGLAHYLEHLMFKGTSQFGSLDFEKEKPLLDTITSLFEHYRTLTDPAERKAAYHIIDSISGVASQYAIPNEYDKMMALIGASGSNAYTSTDVTCYHEDLPSNQVDNYMHIQSERFKDPVFRLFHTELEAVYEEKNISMTRDMSKEFETLCAMLFPTHPYGTQTTIGTQEHLKNPSLINIQNYFDHWYVPGNVAICLSGDFDPDQMIGTIEKYFGDWQAKQGNDNHPAQLTFGSQAPITQPISKEVWGQEAENVMLAWRFEGAASNQMDTLDLALRILSNGEAGLMDLDLNQKQQVLTAGAMTESMNDYSLAVAYGMPLPGQSLDEVRALLLKEVQKLAQGEWDEMLLQSVLTETKLNFQHALEDNSSRAGMLTSAFINGEDWGHAMGMTQRQEKISKQDVMSFASRHLTDANYVYVNKRQGEDPDVQRIEKPQITPVESNRDAKSVFLTAIESNAPADIEPAFIDYSSAVVKQQSANGLDILYKKNETNQLMDLDYLWEMGSNADKLLPIACSYADYIGTSKLSPEEVKSAFYALGCSFSLSCSGRRFYANVSGLDENLEKAIDLLEQILADAQPDESTFATFIQMLIKERQDNKLNQGANFRALVTYATYGQEYVKAHTLSDAELMSLTAVQMTDLLHSLSGLRHRVIYYGPSSVEEVAQVIGSHHNVTSPLAEVPANQAWPMLETSADVVYLAPYKANNTYMTQVSRIAQKYDAGLEPSVTLYNEYFGSSMNAIVFQEMRETRGLAYSASAALRSPREKDAVYGMNTMIATQNDKLPEAITHFNEIINEMPESEPAFQNAKSALISRYRTQRTTRSSVLWTYLSDVEEFGLAEDPDKTVFDGIQSMTLADLVKFQQLHVKGLHYSYCVLGDPAQLDLGFLKSCGSIRKVTTEQIFGY